MSNKVSIEEMNEAIALFMGGLSIKEHGGKRYVYYTKSCAREVAELGYHSSWDALMPCWEKFRNNVSDHFDEDFPPEYCAMCDAWALYCEHVNINGAHSIIYEGIQWFKKQSTTTNDTITRND